MLDVIIVFCKAVARRYIDKKTRRNIGRLGSKDNVRQIYNIINFSTGKFPDHISMFIYKLNNINPKCSHFRQI